MYLEVNVLTAQVKGMLSAISQKCISGLACITHKIPFFLAFLIKRFNFILYIVNTTDTTTLHINPVIVRESSKSFKYMGYVYRAHTSASDIHAWISTGHCKGTKLSLIINKQIHYNELLLLLLNWLVIKRNPGPSNGSHDHPTLISYI